MSETPSSVHGSSSLGVTTTDAVVIAAAERAVTTVFANIAKENAAGREAETKTAEIQAVTERRRIDHEATGAKWRIVAYGIASTLVIALVALALVLGKENFAAETFRLTLALIAGSAGGYGLGLTKRRPPGEDG